MLFLGLVMEPRILVAFGNTTTFLVIASLAGMGWTIHALFDP
jgi:hypothetical protein